MLFATDLDGTLVGRYGRIHPRDIEAIRRARARGVIFTIATGRLTSGTHPVARELGLDAPLVCADGGITACGKTEELLVRRPIPMPEVERILTLFAEKNLSTFVFTHDTIHACRRGIAHHPYVSGWSPSITTHADVASADAWRSGPSGAVMMVGIGEPAHVEAVAGLLAGERSELDALVFGFGDHSSKVVRFVARGVSKGAAVAALAEKLGIAREHVAVAGDWHNDVSMFEWAGRSYAMPHAPRELKDRATTTLEHGSYEKGGVAEALERWQAELG
jgi:Cof subfamily protein (haloacid dehalogenase superfamily)